MRPHLALLSLFLLLLTGCSSARELPYVNLADLDPTLAAGAQSISPRPVLRFAASPMLSPQETLLQYGPLFDYVGQKLNRHVEIVVPRSYGEAVDQVRSGGVHLALVSTYAYVQGHSDFGMEALVAPVLAGRPEHRSYILVRRYSSLTQFSHLKGHAFAYTDPLSTSGRLYPESLVVDLNESVDRFFEHTIFTAGHDSSIQALEQGVVDGAAVDSMVYDMMVRRDPDLQRRLRILEASEPAGSPPLVVNPDLPSELKRQLLEVLLGMNEDPEGRQVLEGLGIDEMVAAEDRWYDPVRELARQLGMKS